MCGLKHYWRDVEAEALELPGLSSGIKWKAACIQTEIIMRKNQESCSRTLFTLSSYRSPLTVCAKELRRRGLACPGVRSTG